MLPNVIDFYPYPLLVVRWAGAALLVLPFAPEPLPRDWPTIRAKWWLYLLYGGVGSLGVPA